MRPATPLICAFIDEHKERFGVVPICRALGIQGVAIAPRTYWAHRSSAPSKRALWDTTITEILAGYYEPDADGKRPPESLYGSLKMWAHLQRQGIPVARRTVERIMRHNGWQGVTRARRPPRTTERDPAAARAPDLVGRRWRLAAPNLLDVADFTYVPLDTGGFGYTAFVIDAYAGLIPGWECSMTKDTGFVERALRHAAVQIAEGSATTVRIGADDLATILGPSRFENEIAMRTSVPGVATGLAWTPVGGDILFIEAAGSPGSGKLTLTGQLGDVMKESAQAALTLVKARAAALGIDPAGLDKTDIHVHVPAGAIPKDGPSAGVAMFTASWYRC